MLSSGCATFRSGVVNPLQPWPPGAVQSRKSIAVTVRMDRTMDIGPGKGPAPVGDDDLNQFRGKVWAEYQDSGAFSEVKTGLEDADVRADVHIAIHQWGSLTLAMLSGFTLMVVPLKTNVDDFVITTVFTDRNGKVLGTIQKKETLDTWFQLFLVGVAPFKNVISQFDAATADIVRATILEARTQGIL
jgi:hypothetical protein